MKKIKENLEEFDEKFGTDWVGNNYNASNINIVYPKDIRQFWETKQRELVDDIREMIKKFKANGPEFDAWFIGYNQCKKDILNKLKSDK